MGPTPLFDASQALLPLISKVFSETDRELVPKRNKLEIAGKINVVKT